MIALLGLLTLSPANAVTPDGILFRKHVQKFIGTKWFHNHTNWCDVAGPYFVAGDAPWDFDLDQAGATGKNQDAAFLDYTICETGDQADVDAIELAMDALRASGMQLNDVAGTCTALNPFALASNITSGNGDWYSERDPVTNEWRFDDNHGVRVVNSAADPFYAIFSILPAATPGISFTSSMLWIDAPAGWVPSPRANWELFLNRADYNLVSEQPSDFFPDPIPPTVLPMRHLTNIVTHETMHTVGAGHAGSLGLGPDATNVGSSIIDLYGDLGLEVDAILYDPINGPQAGVHKVPVTNQKFLKNHYYVPGWNWTDVRMHQWESRMLGTFIDIAQVGWEGQVNSNIYLDFKYSSTTMLDDSTCDPGDKDLDQTVLDTIAAALPRFTSAVPHTLEVEFGTLDIVPDGFATGISFSGKATVEVPDDGSYSTVPAIPELTATNAYTTFDGNSTTQFALLVTATIKDVTDPGAEVELWSDVPLNVEIVVRACSAQ